MATPEYLPLPPQEGIPGIPGSDICYLVYKATDQNNTSEDWATMIDIADKVKVNNDRARMAVKTIIERLQLKNANVILYSMILADSLVKNCPNLQKDFVSRPFLDVVTKKLNDKSIHVSLKTRILQILHEWNESMKSNPDLAYMHDVYNVLKAQGHKFPDSTPHVPQRPQLPTPNNRTVTKSVAEQEEEELQLALALSLSELENKPVPRSEPTPPPMGSIQKAPQHNSMQPVSPINQEPERKYLFQVRALYDFAGDGSQGELSLLKGDVISVTDTSFKDWWKGECKDRTGIFPQNYTERIKEAPKEDPMLEQQVLQASHYVDRFLEILSKVDPKTENLSENEELQEAYREMVLMRPKLVKLIEVYSTKKEDLLALNEVFTKAQGTYQRLVSTALQQHRQSAQNPYYYQ